MKKWYLKGRTGHMLSAFRAVNVKIYVTKDVRIGTSHAIISSARKTLVGVTLRGSSKCRRRMFRELKRYIEAGNANDVADTSSRQSVDFR